MIATLAASPATPDEIGDVLFDLAGVKVVESAVATYYDGAETQPKAKPKNESAACVRCAGIAYAAGVCYSIIAGGSSTKKASPAGGNAHSAEQHFAPILYRAPIRQKIRA